MAILSPRFGGLSDRIGRKKIIMWGLLGDVILGVFSGLAPNWIWLLLIRVFNGVATAAAMLPAEALLIDLVSERRRGEASGFVAAMSMIGRSVGPVFGGTIQYVTHSIGFPLQTSYRIPYFMDSILAALALVLVLFLIREPKQTTETEKTRGIPPKTGQPRKTGLSRSIKILLVSGVITGIGVGFLMPISVLFYYDKFGIEPVEIGFILSVTGLIGIAASWVGGRVSDRIGRKPVLAVGGFAARIFSLVLPLTFDVNQAAIVMTLRSIGFNVFMPAIRALRADIVPKEARGRIFGLFFTAFTAGSIVGPIIGTWLYSLYRFETWTWGGISIPGYGIPFFVYAALGFISLTLIILFVKDKQTPVQIT